jgi:predicted O-methyltransferase YrrM
MAKHLPGSRFLRASERALQQPDAHQLHADALRNAVYRALVIAHDRKWTSGQLAAFERIEALRASLMADQRPIKVIDYGAGATGETRSKELMAAGLVTQVPISQVSMNSKPTAWAQMLYQVVLETRPRACLEMGTCVGLTAAYIALALKEAGDGGALISLEGAPSIAEIAKRTLASQQLEKAVEIVVGPFSATLASALARKSLDFVFVDGHHDREATIDYWQQILPHLSDRSLVVFDDIRWSPGMEEAWTRISSDPRVNWSVDLDVMGIVRPR